MKKTDSTLLPIRLKNNQTTWHRQQVNAIWIITVLVPIFLAYQNVYSQDHEPSWILLKESEGVKAFYHISECNSRSEIHFKIHNTDIVDKNVIWMASIRGRNVALPSMTPVSLKQGDELISMCGAVLPTLMMPLDQPIEISELDFHLIITR